MACSSIRFRLRNLDRTARLRLVDDHALGQPVRQLLQLGDHADHAVLGAEGVQGIRGAVERLGVQGAKSLVQENGVQGHVLAGGQGGKRLRQREGEAARRLELGISRFLTISVGQGDAARGDDTYGAARLVVATRPMRAWPGVCERLGH